MVFLLGYFVRAAGKMMRTDGLSDFQVQGAANAKRYPRTQSGEKAHNCGQFFS